MNSTPHIPVVHALMRTKAARAVTGDCESAFYAKVAGGLMTKPIKINSRATALPVREVEAINAARIRGASDAEIKALVAQLHADRCKAA